MPPLVLSHAREALAVAMLSVALVGSGCRKIATQPQCDAMLDRYVDLIVAEADAGSDAGGATRARAKELAETDDDFRSCASKVDSRQYECAMKATTADGFEKCLE